MDDQLSPRHSRRRSMPASFRLGESDSSLKDDGREAKLDRFSISNNWERFRNQLVSKAQESSIKKAEEAQWKRSKGLTGGLFFGYDNPKAEEAFFRFRLERKRMYARLFQAVIVVALLFEWIRTEQSGTMWQLTFLNLLVAMIFLGSFEMRALNTEKSMACFIFLIGLLEGSQNPALRTFITEGASAVVVAASGKESGVRKFIYVMFAILLIGNTTCLGFRPSVTAAISVALVTIANAPIYLSLLPRISCYSDLEILLAIAQPVNYMGIAAVIINVYLSSSDRAEFEQDLLNFEVHQLVDSVSELSRQRSSSDSLRPGGRSSIGSLSSLQSMDSIGALVQESVIDQRLRGFQRILGEYPIKRNTVVRTLIEVCVAAMALSLKQKSDSNPNWTEFFSIEQDRDGPMQTSIRNHQAKSLSPLDSGSRRKRRHSVVVVASTREDAIHGNDSASLLGVRHRRSSSVDLTTSVSPPLITDFSAEEGTDLDRKRRLDLELLMKDWNFGPSRGIWTALFSENRAPLYSNPLCTVTMQAISSMGLFKSPDLLLDEATCRCFFNAIEQAYLPKKDVPYHNALHACDVVQTIFSTLSNDAVLLPDLGLFALILAASAHDVAHPGLNNAHLIVTRNALAVTYNDRSVLENFHAAKTFAILAKPENDVLVGIRSRADGSRLVADFRSMVIEMILATDLKYHFDQQAKVRLFIADKKSTRLVKSSEDSETETSESSLNKRIFEFSQLPDVSLICSTLLHMADISNVAKDWASYKPWMDLLFEEFFHQGDLEKTLGIEPQDMMNRHTCLPATAQSQFIRQLVMPLYEVMRDVIPCTAALAVEEMENNLVKLQELTNNRGADDDNEEETKKDR